MPSDIPKIALIAARGRNNVIGSDGDLPWRLSSDLKLFKSVTKGKPVIMGRKTWESLPRRPLPGRLNIVVTRQGGYAAEGAEIAAGLDQAIELAKRRAQTDNVEEIFIIGGAQIYAAAMHLAERLYLTEVDASPDGEAVFPEFHEKDWSELSSAAYGAGEADEYDFVFRSLERAG